MMNQFIDASIRGTLIGISLFFWGFWLVSIWKWLFGVAKTFIKWLFPNYFKKKKADSKIKNM